MKTKIIDRWKPIRSGRFYCSPACGGGKFCTWAQYQEATKKAAALTEKLKKAVGGNWEPHVHENLGWHYHARLSTKLAGSVNDEPLLLKVYESSGYSCMFGEGVMGDCSWHIDQHYSTPQSAVTAQLVTIRRYVARRNEELAALEAALKGEPLTDEPCPSTIKLMTSAYPEKVECQGRKGHTGSHWHLNLNWKDQK